MKTTRRWPLLALVLSGGLTSGDALALDSDEAIQKASQLVVNATASLSAYAGSASQAETSRSASQRIADALLLLGSKDYTRAAVELTKVIEKYPDHPSAYAEAVSLLANVYFQSGQELSAQRMYQMILAQSADPRFSTYQAVALARMTGIALRTKNDRLLDDVLAAIDRLPAQSRGSSISYAKGKALFVRGDLAGARDALTAVDANSDVAHQARYLLGVVALKSLGTQALTVGNSGPALAAFDKVIELPAKTDTDRHVVDLAWLAKGRIAYATEQWIEALRAYGKIQRTSTELGAMLYELAWVYVRLGDTSRALRALEVLAVVDTEGTSTADATLLRADLLLRGGQFEKSLRLYESVRSTFDPMVARVDMFVASVATPGEFYNRLSQESEGGVKTAYNLPPVALSWAREMGEGPAAFGVLDEVGRSRELMNSANELVEKIGAILNAPNRVRAFPELRAGAERNVGLANMLATARYYVGQGLDDVEGGALSGEVGAVRAQRRALEPRLALLPVSPADFAKRDREGERQWNKVSQSLQRLTLQVDQLQAAVNGMRRLVYEGGEQGVVRSAGQTTKLETDLALAEGELGIHRQTIGELRKLVNRGRVQVGFGDQRFVEDADVRAKYASLLQREIELCQLGMGGQDSQVYASRVSQILVTAGGADARIQAALQEIDVQVDRKAATMLETVARETNGLVGYSVKLEELDTESRTAVGEVVAKNFGLVRERLKNIVMRADVGTTEEAWEVREAQAGRVRTLQVERAREERVLREELNEILEDSGSTEEDK